MRITKPDDIVQEEILCAAISLYRKHGPAKVTMDEVAAASGRSRTSLYYYYKNREEIFEAVLKTIINDVIKEIRRDVNEAGETRGKIRALCIAKIKTTNNWSNVFKAMWVSMNAEEKTKHTKMMGTLHSKLVYHEGIIFQEILAEGTSRQEIRSTTPAEQDMLGFILSSGIRGLRNEVYDKNDPHNITDALNLLADVITKWVEI